MVVVVDFVGVVAVLAAAVGATVADWSVAVQCSPVTVRMMMMMMLVVVLVVVMTLVMVLLAAVVKIVMIMTLITMITTLTMLIAVNLTVQLSLLRCGHVCRDPTQNKPPRRPVLCRGCASRGSTCSGHTWRWPALLAK